MGRVTTSLFTSIKLLVQESRTDLGRPCIGTLGAADIIHSADLVVVIGSDAAEGVA